VTGPRLLIADDDASIRGLLRVIAQRNALHADEASNGVDALDLLDRNVYDVVLLDLSMPHLNGFDLIDLLRHKSRRPAVIVLTALSRSSFRDLDPAVVHCVIRKPFDVDLLMTLIVSAANALYDRREKAVPASWREPPPEARM
jgi:DNA-binding response OmpR family regulator